jgi:hypothetical protein
MTPQREYFHAATSHDLDRIVVAGDAHRLPHPDFLRLKISGIDPQLLLPVLDIPSEERPLQIQLSIFMHPDPSPRH